MKTAKGLKCIVGLCIAASAVCPIHFVAAAWFDPHVEIAVGTSPQSVFVGDANHDGKNDIVTANDGSNNVSVLLWNGTGFGPAISLPAGNGPSGIFVGDVDGDGVNEIVTANVRSNDVSVIRWNGSGFDPEIRLPAGSGPLSVCVGDVDHDGHNEIVVANIHTNDVSVIRWNGSGFDPQLRLGVGTLPWFVTIGDADNDGINEIVTANDASDNVSLVRWNGTGFDPQQKFAVGFEPYAVAVGDADNDGYNDILTANYTSRDLSLLRWNGSGFDPEVRLGAVSNPQHSVVIGDADNDGKNDIVTAIHWSNAASFMRWNGTGFDDPILLPAGDSPVSVVVADADNDGHNDIITANTISNTVSLIRWNPSAATPTPTQTPTPTPSPTATPTPTPTPNPASSAEKWERVVDGFYEGQRTNLFEQSIARAKAAAADMDGDGDLDLVIGGAQYVRLFRNDGTKARPAWTLANDNLLNLPPEREALHPVVADFDGDGLPDIVVCDLFGTIYYYHNDGNLTFHEETIPGLTGDFGTGNEMDVAAGDLNGDGATDILVATHGPVYYLENVGGKANPQFAPRVDLGLEGPPIVSISLADIDGDGKLDLFCSTSPDGQCYTVARPFGFSFYRNVGTPQSFSFHLETNAYFGDLLTTDICVSPTIFDADGDGKCEALLFGISGPLGYYGFLRNIGTISSPSWKLTHDYFNTFTYRHLTGGAAFGDLNGDGKLELIQAGMRVAFGLFENTGSPTVPNWRLANDSFIPHPNPSTSYVSPVLCDIDNDGKLDFFAIEMIGPADNHLRFWKNVGTNTSPSFEYQPGTWQGLSGCIQGFCFGDLDGDGLPDLVLGRYHTTTVTWLRNQGPPSDPIFGPETPLVEAVGAGTTDCQLFPCLVDVDGDGDLDLFVGTDNVYTGEGQTNFFRNVGTPTAPGFALEQTRWMDRRFYYYPTPVSADIDGDGFPNVFVNDYNGGMLQYRCVRPSLSIYPRDVTVTTDQTVDFNASGSVSGPVTWSLLASRSGGTINPTTGSYVSGSITGVVDAIEARDTSGTIGRAYVNVISTSRLSASGKAVVMAGRKANDPLWDSTNYLANSVYRMLLYRGFSKPNIRYLNPVTGQDVDGNGANDDIYAPSSLANIQSALTTFAAGSPNLFVYLIDHGEADAQTGTNGSIRCNESDVLYASTLKGWLDDLQANHGVTTVTLVVDCCQSGSFLAACAGAGAGAPAGCSRVVATSCSPVQPAFFSAGGLISFTDAFVNGLTSGLTVGQAFSLAAAGMDRYQQPAMDDTGDGVYNKDADGAIADRLVVGATNIAGADRPQIGVISANQSLMGGDAHATIWASDVSSVYPIDRVWATIAAPNFIPAAQANPGDPVTGLTTASLTWNDAATPPRYEATLTGLTEMGAYKVNFYAQDIWGGVSYPKQTYINQTASDERMVIACGNGAYDSNSPWSYTDYLSRSAYDTARARWLDHDKIAYLTAAASVAERPVDGAATRATLQAAIADAAAASPPVTKFTLYLVGSGNAGAFDINGNGTPSDPDVVTPADLEAWLNAAQTAVPTMRVVVVLDFSQSGAWIGPLQVPAGRSRVVIASCDGAEASWCEAGGMLSFSQWFFSEIFSGVNVRTAFNWARSAIRAVSAEHQNPALDDTGDGVADWRDGALAKTTYIGAAFVTGADSPVIGDYAKDVILTSNTDTLWASGVWSAQPIDTVFATIIRPGATSENGLIDTVPLAYNAANGRWEATYSNFDPSDFNKVVYFAKDRAGSLSPPYEATFGPLIMTARDWMLY